MCKIYITQAKLFQIVLLYDLFINVYYILFTEEFNNYMQQDAHEFLNFLINHINEIILCKYNIVLTY